MVDCSPGTRKAGICLSAAGFKSEGISVGPAGLDPGASLSMATKTQMREWSSRSLSQGQ